VLGTIGEAPDQRPDNAGDVRLETRFARRPVRLPTRSLLHRHTQVERETAHGKAVENLVTLVEPERPAPLGQPPVEDRAPVLPRQRRQLDDLAFRQGEQEIARGPRRGGDEHAHARRQSGG